MEAYDILPCSPSTQIITNSQELEDGVAGMELKSSERRVCRIAFEEYLDIWMRIATTNPELLKESDSLDEFIKYTEKCAVNYGSASSDKDCLIQMQQCNIPVRKLPKKRSRVERMRRLYMQCRASEPLIPQIPGPAQGSVGREHWEKEMDELVEWTHSLSLKELDNL
ncbi:hypothetical protein F2P79_021404 [Pimephales promelas]|nr:hypothetical protein F2P79_021404 [Pimephales promelas]